MMIERTSYEFVRFLMKNILSSYHAVSLYSLFGSLETPRESWGHILNFDKRNDPAMGAQPPNAPRACNTNAR